MRWGARVWTGLNWLWIGSSGGSFEYSNEPSDFSKDWNFIEMLSDS